MKKTIPLFCILCSFTLSALSQNPNNVIVDKLPGVSKIESQALKVPPILFRPIKTCVVDSFLIVAQARPDTILSIYKLPDCKYLLSFGVKGRGPNEFFSSSPSFTLAPVFNRKSSFAIGNNMNNVQYYMINEILKKNITPYKIEKLPAEMEGILGVGYFSDTLIIGSPGRLEMLLFKYRVSNHKISLFKNYPNKYSFEDINSLRNVYAGSFTVKNDNSKFALAYGNKGIIEIYSADNNNPITISYKDFPTLEENLGLNKSSKFIPSNPAEKIFCWGITSTNRYIYAKIYNDKYSNISDGKGLLRSYIAEIHVFDWSGKLISRLKTDYFYTEFNVDVNDKYLYTIDENIENIIRRYDLQKVSPK